MIKSKKYLVLGVAVSGFALTQVAQAVEFEVGDAKAEVYGFAQMNAAYDLDENLSSSTQAGQFSGITTGGGDTRDGHFDADADQSRLGVAVTHANGVKTVLEGDFRGGNFRLRQAYGSFENWTIGKTWSNYNSWTGWTPTLDFDSSAGAPGVQDRTTQVRYTTGGFSVALEEDYYPNIDVATYDDDGEDSNDGNARSSMPVFTARYEGSASDNVNFVAAGLLRQLTNDTGAQDDSAMGFGAFTGVDVDMGGVTLHAVVNYSDGANGYLYRSGGNFGGTDAYLDGNDLETVSAYGGSIGLSTKIGEGDFNIVYGTVKMDLDDMNDDLGTVADNHERNTNVFVNYMWYPVENVMMGVELAHFDVEEYNGDDGDATRLMYSAKYSF
ncbi:DcaP family trimeric outer membrane transporter [Marinomonas ostreistagni]|uniref:DcaP family trimeric outer membrane transporter n=1 Tax=Marinomonas ostreistagni TaxID=359209 RepID=UPI00194FCD60|nr:DcaP family trimeric outer membrane transporter [Marinomonas ostreistagni]MBM6550163.1 hypothetical protein [Marinomonas ostreistagni]